MLAASLHDCCLLRAHRVTAADLTWASWTNFLERMVLAVVTEDQLKWWFDNMKQQGLVKNPVECKKLILQ